MSQIEPFARSRAVLPTSLVEDPGAITLPDGAEASPRTRFDQLTEKVNRALAQGPVHFVRKGLGFVRSELRTRAVFRSSSRLGVGVRIVGLLPSLSNEGGTLVIGDSVMFAAPVTPIRLELRAGAFLGIGDETFLNDGVWLGCTQSIHIGRRVLIGPGVRCLDNDYHGLYRRRVLPPARPITIEDDAWLAANCLILPGVAVGRGAVVAAGSVVVRDVEPYTVVAGNPARPIRILGRDRFEAGQGSAGHSK
jgi:acetyltransferase-like isoleucine patch superfamily enzyme